LVRAAVGRIWDVAVDIRPESSTFGRWYGVELNDQERKQLFVPVGFAHGFCVLSDFAEVQYKVSSPYDAATECGIAYADPDLNVPWPVASPILSARDQQAESFASFLARVKA
jgi:dTDP-4-dehydrorhamnose 3,5-epimerase